MSSARVAGRRCRCRSVLVSPFGYLASAALTLAALFAIPKTCDESWEPAVRSDGVWSAVFLSRAGRGDARLSVSSPKVGNQLFRFLVRAGLLSCQASGRLGDDVLNRLECGLYFVETDSESPSPPSVSEYAVSQPSASLRVLASRVDE